MNPANVVVFGGNLSVFCFYCICFFCFLSLVSCSFTIMCKATEFLGFFFCSLILLGIFWILKCMTWCVSSILENSESFFLQLLPMFLFFFLMKLYFRPFYCDVRVSYSSAFSIFLLHRASFWVFSLTYIPVH